MWLQVVPWYEAADSKLRYPVIIIVCHNLWCLGSLCRCLAISWKGILFACFIWVAVLSGINLRLLIVLSSITTHHVLTMCGLTGQTIHQRGLGLGGSSPWRSPLQRSKCCRLKCRPGDAPFLQMGKVTKRTFNEQCLKLLRCGFVDRISVAERFSGDGSRSEAQCSRRRSLVQRQFSACRQHDR